MPRFYFHIESGAERLPDPEGGNFASIGAARLAALEAAAALTAEGILSGSDFVAERIAVENETGEQVLTVETEAKVRVRTGDE